MSIPVCEIWFVVKPTSGINMIGANTANVTGYTGTITMHNPTLSPSARISGNTMTTSRGGCWASVVIGMRLVGGRHYWAARVNKLTYSDC